MSTYTKITLLTGLTLLLLSSRPAGAQHTIAYTFPLPSSRETGLVKASFNITTSFRVMTIAGNKEADLIMTMNVAPATAQSPRPSFEYRYMYHGEVFTDQDVGTAPFYKLRTWLVEFDVIVQGRGKTWDFSLSKADKTKYIKVPLDSKAEQYTAKIMGMNFIQFEGQQDIENAIRKLLEKRKTAAAKPQNANTSTNPLQSTAATGNNTAKASTTATTNKEADDDFWEEKKPAKTGSAGTPSRTTAAPQVDYTKQLREAQTAYFDQTRESHARIEQQGALAMSSYYAAQAVNKAKSNLQSLSRLDGNYESIEELNADFESKYYAINQAVEELSSARQQSYQASYNSLYNNANETNRAIGQAVVAAGSMISEMAAEKKRRQMQEQLRRERAAEEARIKEKKWQALVSSRREMLKRFPDGGVPLSFHKVSVNDLYFFAYVLDTTDIRKQAPVAMLTNVFPVSRYGDGTWPFKNGLTGDLKKVTGAGKITIMGYYTTEKLANDMRAAFENIAGKCQVKVKHYTYKGKKSAAGNSNTDFWGNEKSGEKNKKAAPAKKDDFWEN
ncbi:hypothetical protein [Chitinophaga cymbidii]|uniref:Uncharacterized protein n=1 Tax=Chitinophaga cymbidii TaxID=1096750 RepID=A0A512RQD2_9BACT|nr:hypothetical protein [Chitinophaga cymbidii]GEP97903.1 hypothetical protein CCY01nite_41630 [Chitinophaga cymbidii]